MVIDEYLCQDGTKKMLGWYNQWGEAMMGQFRKEKDI